MTGRRPTHTESAGPQRRAKEAIEQLDSDLRAVVAEHAKATEQVRQAEGDVTAAERVIDDATSARA